ncbi:hypothetical protein MMC29_005447 [Sticta canariensis]|nr:hypothetical protein [Sticta canariensis]
MESEKQQQPQAQPQAQPQMLLLPRSQRGESSFAEANVTRTQSLGDSFEADVDGTQSIGTSFEADVNRTQSPETSVSGFAVSPESSFPISSSDLLSDPTLGGMLSIDGLSDLLLDSQTNTPSSESSLELANKSTLSPDFSFDLLDTDLSINQFVMPDIVNPNHVSSTGSCCNAPIRKHEPFADQYGQNRRYSHVLALTRIIELLETHIQLQPTAIDELMRMNKACMIDITRIMELKEYARCKSCGILVSVAMELVVTLYEMGVSLENNTSSKQQGQHSALGENELPNLQFGVFEVDAEEQIEFRNRIICKELRRSIEIIKKFSERNQITARENPHSGKVRKQWYVEMEHRAKRLISSLGGSFD